jgi:hypothetical protein
MVRRQHVARPATVRLWPRSTADPDGAATIANLAALEQLVLWPKLFRRIVPYLASGFGDFDGFDAWLRADPVNRDDELFLLDKLERGNMHDVVRGIGASRSSSRSGPRTSSSAPTHYRGAAAPAPGRSAPVRC